MLAPLVLLVATPALAMMEARVDGSWESTAEHLLPAEPLVSLHDERDGHFAPPLRERSKKELWLLEKAWRPNVHVRDADLAQKRRCDEPRPRLGGTPMVQAEARLVAPSGAIGTCLQPITTLFNIWNREAMPLIAGQPYKRPFQLFLRDHYTKQSTQADTRLAPLLVAAALRFRAPRVEIVSGYRSPKYNLMLRKKGHQVARESQHTLGTAVDFRIYGVATEALREFVRSLRMGGVGFYPRTRFIHADTGKVRYWQGS